MKIINLIKGLASSSVLVVLFLGCHLTVFGQTSEEKEILETFKNKETVVYKTVDGKELEMIIFYPDADKINKKKSMDATCARWWLGRRK